MKNLVKLVLVLLITAGTIIAQTNPSGIQNNSQRQDTMSRNQGHMNNKKKESTVKPNRSRTQAKDSTKYKNKRMHKDSSGTEIKSNTNDYDK